MSDVDPFRDATIHSARQRPTDAELDAESIITADDIARAVEIWYRDSGLPGMLDAEPLGDDDA